MVKKKENTTAAKSKTENTEAKAPKKGTLISAVSFSGQQLAAGDAAPAELLKWLNETGQDLSKWIK